MGLLVEPGQKSESVPLCGAKRIWATQILPAATPPGPAPVLRSPGLVWLELRFQLLPRDGVIWAGLTRRIGSAEDTAVIVAADLGSYHVRPAASVQIVVSAAATEPANVRLVDADEVWYRPQVYWKTFVLDADTPWAPPPWYDRFAVESGTIQYGATSLATQNEVRWAGGEIMALRGPAIVRFGFEI